VGVGHGLSRKSGGNHARGGDVDSELLLPWFYRGIFYVAEVTSRLVDKPGFIELISSFGFDIVNHVSALSILLSPRPLLMRFPHTPLEITDDPLRPV
jgi:hypothetical protein